MLNPAEKANKMERNPRSNPWKLLNPFCAKTLTLVTSIIILSFDLIIIFINWNVSCSQPLKIWIIGKYLFPFLSYISCFLFIPCNLEETLDAIEHNTGTYSQREARVRELHDNMRLRFVDEAVRGREKEVGVVAVNSRSQLQGGSGVIVERDDDEKEEEGEEKGEDEERDMDCCGLPHPVDTLCTEWLLSPSETS